MFCEGGCACGAVRYGLKTSPLVVHACHCRDCQRLTGAAYATNAGIEENNVQLISGELKSFNRKGGSGADHEVFSCSLCSTAVWSKYAGGVSMLFLRVGTFDNPELVSPHTHIFTRSKHPSVVLPSDVPAFQEFYTSRRGVWPEESVARLKAARDGG